MGTVKHVRKIVPLRTTRRVREVLSDDTLRQIEGLALQWKLSGVATQSGRRSRIRNCPGIVALFTGADGTGKTMAARYIAGTLGMDLCRVDLSGLVSNYIGETEKNLTRIFDQALGNDLLLFFDEADALFGKRTLVPDAHGRHTNPGVAYLLQ